MKFHVMKAFSTTPDVLEKQGYIYEPKLDGFRALCYVNSSIELLSRNNLSFAQQFPEILKIRKNIRADSCVLDGEIIAYDQHGNPNINALKNGDKALYVVFDILMKDGESLTELPLLERKKILESTVIDGTYIQKILYTDQGELLWKEIKKHGGEGVVAKERDGLYYSGKRSKVWLKLKIFNTLDCVIMGYNTGKRLIRSLALGLYNAHGELTYIGDVGSGFSQDLIAKLYAMLSPIALKSQPVIASAKHKKIIWVKPKYVCEVRYQEFTPYNMLRISQFLQLRTDKNPKECTFVSQLKTV
jgi:bifunctional non-homologous end joining protein LigD